MGEIAVSSKISASAAVAKQQSRKTVLIVNPRSNSGKTGKNWEALYEQILQVSGLSDVDTAFSERSGQGTELARNYLKRGYREIYAVGGDGTANEVANGFFESTSGIWMNDRNDNHSPSMKPINSEAKLGFVPCGTRNALASSLGLAPYPLGFSIGLHDTPSGVSKVDVVAVRASSKDDHTPMSPRLFLNAAEIGIGAEIIGRSKKARKHLKNRLISTVAGVVSTIPFYESNESVVSLDDGPQNTFEVKMTMAIVANGRFLGGGFKIAPLAKLGDGLMDVVVLKESGSLKILDKLASMKAGEHLNDDNIIYGQAERAAIRSSERDVAVSADGEPVGILPAEFRVFHNAMNLIVPSSAEFGL